MDRNFVLALVLTMLIFVGYDTLFVAPKRATFEAERQAAAQAEAEAAAAVAEAAANGEIVGGGEAPIVDLGQIVPVDQALERSGGRLPIKTPQLNGSLNLKGLSFDDIVLNEHTETVEEGSPSVRVLSPLGSPYSQYTRTGLALNGREDTGLEWVAPEGAVLTPETPVVLRAATSRDDFEYTATVSVDDKFMFTIEHQVVNRTGTDITIKPYGIATQNGIPNDLENFMILYEGPLGAVDQAPFARKYKKLLNDGPKLERGSRGWVGITDKYWLSAAIPTQGQPLQAKLDVVDGATPRFTASYELDTITIPSGQGTAVTSYVFAGAKLVDVLRDYQKPIEDGGLGIAKFEEAVDWGFLYLLTKPIFQTLHFFNGIFGNYGIAILMLTLVIKAILFPLANMSYKSLAGMRKVQPEMQRLKERYKDDQMKFQQEMMGLYKKHKINPAAGCLPILAQMPIFYALYKTLFVTIEMRHEPFLYISDLAEPDPTTIFNLFGLLPFDPTALPVLGAFLGIGILPLLMGAGMWVQMKLNPPPTDPMQAKIFSFMPLIFLFLFANFAAGLVLYWAWNTFLGVVQQYVIMKRQGVDVDLIGNIKTSLGLGNKPALANDNKAGE